MDPVEAAFAPLLGVPSWLVRKGHGSFITFEFGSPTVEIAEPYTTRVDITGAHFETLRRPSHVHGQWHLWIYCCDWSLSLQGALLAHCESDDVTINRGLGVLNGQAIIDVRIDYRDATTTFLFDLGCVLVTRPAEGDVYGVEPVEQWMLYQPDKNVLTARSDGSYQVVPASSREELAWSPLSESST